MTDEVIASKLPGCHWVARACDVWRLFMVTNEGTQEVLGEIWRHPVVDEEWLWHWRWHVCVGFGAGPHGKILKGGAEAAREAVEMAVIARGLP